MNCGLLPVVGAWALHSEPDTDWTCGRKLLSPCVRAVVARLGTRDEGRGYQLGSYQAAPSCTDQRCGRTESYPRSGSCDADGLWASECAATARRCCSPCAGI